MNLAGITIIRNSIQFDYHIELTIASLLQVCDHVFVVDCGSTDGTNELLDELDMKYPFGITILDGSKEWEETNGKERLSVCTNIAVREVKQLGFKYQLMVQADEIIHESSYKYIKLAMKYDREGYMATRVNLWGSPYRYLTVPTERQPCSTQVMRLTKVGNYAYDDAENLVCNNPNFGFLQQIRIFHMGFVRKRDVMKNKIANMQQNVFGMEHYDPKLDMEQRFNPWLWFDKEKDTSFINEPLPAIIREWARERAKDYE